MSARPKINIELTTSDKIFEAIGWMALAILWGLTLWNYSRLPETIPVHFNILGEPDGFGSKKTLLMFPIIGTVLFLGMTILNKFPHVFNYPTKITEENALRQYTGATRMVRYLKFAVILIFSIIVFKTLKTLEGKSSGLGPWFLPLTAGLIFIPLTFFLVNSFQKKKR